MVVRDGRERGNDAVIAGIAVAVIVENLQRVARAAEIIGIYQ